MPYSIPYNRVSPDITNRRIVNALNDLDDRVGAGGGGSSAWGGITGTLSSQTDLQTALNAKQNSGSYAAATHSHAISDVTGLSTALSDIEALIVTNLDGGGASSEYTLEQTIDCGGA